MITVGHNRALAELALGLRCLRRKDVPRLRVAPLDFAGASLLEALGRARMGLQLGHFLLLYLVLAEAHSPTMADRDFPRLFRLF